MTLHFTDSDLEDPQQDQATVYRHRSRAAWSPVQVVCVLAGLLLVVLGGVGLARTGLHFSDIPFTRTQVAGLPVTSLAALVEVVVGVILLVVAAWPASARAAAAVFGALGVALGLVIALATRSFADMWAFDRASGIFLVVVGAVLLVSSAVAPIVASRRDTTVERRGRRDVRVP